MISVVMATYKGGPYLAVQLDSILTQTYQDIELVVVDDCSPDNSRQILGEYAEKDARIKLHFNEENLGCSRSFEKGCTLATGDYVALVDQDDFWEPNKLEVLLAEIQAGDLDMAYSDCRHMDADGQLLDSSHRDRHRANGLDSTTPGFAVIAAFNSFVLGCSMMLTAEAVKRCLPFEHSRFNHDKWIVANVAAWGKVAFVDQVLFRYRLHGNQYSMRFKKNNARKKLLKHDMSVVIPFVSSEGLARILSFIDESSPNRRPYERMINDVSKFRSGQRLSRIMFALKYAPMLFLGQRPVSQVNNVFKLAMTSEAC